MHPIITTYTPKYYTHICIPRMDANISRDFIFKTFVQLNIGFIENIIEIPIRTTENHKRVILKIRWNQSDMSKKIQSRLHADQCVNIVHKFPFFWKLVISHPQK